MVTTSLKVAEAVWLALARLHRTDPEQGSFTTTELTPEVRRLAPEIKPATIAAMARIFWDRNLFIYLIEQDPRFGKAVLDMYRRMKQIAG